MIVITPDLLVGFVAGALTSLGLFCQLLRILRTRQARDVSTPFFILFMVGVTCWLYYGYALRDAVLVFWNVVGILLCAAVLALKQLYG